MTERTIVSEAFEIKLKEGVLAGKSPGAYSNLRCEKIGNTVNFTMIGAGHLRHLPERKH